MSVQRAVRGMTLTARMLVASSFFCALIWWRISAYLVLAGALVFGLAWLLQGMPRAFAEVQDGGWGTR